MLHHSPTRPQVHTIFLWLWALSVPALPACTLERYFGEPRAGVEEQLLLSLPDKAIDYRHTVKPVLERRCIVCHGCYDAPCQLKLSSLEGLHRGASKRKVYDGTRITGTEPTRLGIDAKSTDEWRGKGFHPVINDDHATPRQNLEDSILYQLLRLKQRHPQPQGGILPDDFDLGLDREQVCAKRSEFEHYARAHPLWGMPYAMPNLSQSEHTTLAQWIAQGAPSTPPTPLSAATREQVKAWEAFFNGESKKQQLVSRYLYEHLFLGHLRFADAPPREFFRLVRSTTPPGKAIDEIATTRPYDDPGDAPFYYRLRPYQASIVAKNHVVYELSAAKMARLETLFLQPGYIVESLPSYQPSIASNPFKAFADIPPDSRYRFMLDDARFFIEGFIKGPVCRGQIALNVIEDNFWVVFFDPDSDLITLNPDFLLQTSDDLEMPNERGDTLRLFAAWTKYWYRLTDYINAKQAYYEQLPDFTLEQAMDFIWDGDGHNLNAALTVFRHFDSASVKFGLAGNYPETAWVLDYPVFERIHYLLVAGFNVYGNAGHQLNTRLYMDFLRMEGEDYFLSFLPVSHRKKIRDSWYVGLRSGLERHLNEPSDWLEVEAVVGYRSDEPQRELYQAIEQRLGVLSGGVDRINRCPATPCQFTAQNAAERDADRIMSRIATISGADLEVVPDLAFLRVRAPETSQPDLVYTLIHNKAYKNITSIFTDADQDKLRDREHDSLTVLKGLHGSYPNFFFDIDLVELEEFVHRYRDVHSPQDHGNFVDRYGVKRSDPRFWEVADWFQDYSANAQPVTSGLFDLYRYRNR